MAGTWIRAEESQLLQDMRNRGMSIEQIVETSQRSYSAVINHTTNPKRLGVKSLVPARTETADKTTTSKITDARLTAIEARLTAIELRL